MRRASAAAALAGAVLLSGGCAPRARPPRTQAIEIRGFVYLPDTLRASPGDTVVWTNRDLVPHTATDDGGRWDSGDVATAASWRMVAGEKGVHPYHCAFHPPMKAVLVVE